MSTFDISKLSSEEACGRLKSLGVKVVEVTSQRDSLLKQVQDVNRTLMRLDEKMAECRTYILEQQMSNAPHVRITDI